jgi:UDP-glucose-4-epimerase GalE
VTGGAGYVGSHFAAALEDAGRDYVVIDSLERGNASFVPTAKLVVADISDRNTVADLCREYRPKIAVHFAAFAYVGESMSDPARYYENNVTKSQALFDTLRANDVEGIVFSSSCATYGIPDISPIDESAPQRPISPYGETKLIVERLLAYYRTAYGLNSVALRYFNACGSSATRPLYERHDPETHLIPLVIRAALDGTPLRIFGNDYDTADGTCVRDYIHVDDLADAHMLAVTAIEHGRELPSMNLGAGFGMSVLEVVAAAQYATQSRVAVEQAPRRRGDPAALIASAALAGRCLGWKAQRSDPRSIMQAALLGERRRRDFADPQ